MEWLGELWPMEWLRELWPACLPFPHRPGTSIPGELHPHCPTVSPLPAPHCKPPLTPTVLPFLRPPASARRPLPPHTSTPSCARP
eukprot:254713-Chlamydomonas_euryale.AAC.1